jgi:hypothetical protein
MKNIYDYLIDKYGQQNAEPTLYMLIDELQQKVKILSEKYQGSLEDIKRLEEENIETSNCLYELQNSIEAVDARIDILNSINHTQNDSLEVTELPDGRIQIDWDDKDPKYSWMNTLTEQEITDMIIQSIQEKHKK